MPSNDNLFLFFKYYDMLSFCIIYHQLIIKWNLSITTKKNPCYDRSTLSIVNNVKAKLCWVSYAYCNMMQIKTHPHLFHILTRNILLSIYMAMALSQFAFIIMLFRFGWVLRMNLLGSSLQKVKTMAQPYTTINTLSFMLEWCTEAFWKIVNPSQDNIGDWRLGHTESLPWAILIQSLKHGECFNTINTAVIAYCPVWERMTSKYGGFNFGIIYSKTFKY